MAAISSNGTGGGNWSSTASWTGGVVPGNGDNVTITAGDTITVDQNITIGDDTGTCLTVNGILDVPYTIGANYTLTMKGNYAGSGEWKIGSSANPLANTSSYTIQINAYDAAPANSKYHLTVPNNGTLSWYGAVKTTHTNLNGAVSASATQIIVDSATNWKIGDNIVCIDRTDRTKMEEFKIRDTYTTGTTIPLALSTDEATGDTMTNAKTDGWEVINLTHNIRVENFSDTYKSYVKLTGTGTDQNVLSNVMLDELGNTSNYAMEFGDSTTDNSNNDFNITLYKCRRVQVNNFCDVEELISYEDLNVGIVFNNSRKTFSVGTLTFIGCTSYCLNVASYHNFWDVGTLNALCNDNSVIRGVFNNVNIDTFNAYANAGTPLQIIGENMRICNFNAENNPDVVQDARELWISNFTCSNNTFDFDIDGGIAIVENYTPSTNGIDVNNQGYVYVTNYNGTVGYNRVFISNTIFQSDTTTFRTSSPSLNCNIADDNKLKLAFGLSSFSRTFYVTDTKSYQLDLYSYKDITSTGATAKIRIRKGTDGHGLSETTEYDIMPSSTTTWTLKQLSLGTATSNGFVELELVVEKGASTWNLNIDDLSLIET